MKLLWKPSTKVVNESNLNYFARYLGINFENDFKKLWEWSVENPDIFWSKFWDFSKIIGEKGTEIIRYNKKK